MRSHGYPSGPRGGATAAELALVLPVLVFLLFSIVELGFMMKNRTELGQAAREGARLAAVGGTPLRITEGINASVQTISPDDIDRTYEFRSWSESVQEWGGWQSLGPLDDDNDAPRGAQLRITVSFPHELLVPGLMGRMLNADESGRVNLAASTVMMRE